MAKAIACFFVILISLLANAMAEDDNPYVFEDRHFIKYRRQHGSINVLRKFAEHSELLRGIQNYRLAILETDPLTFVKPNHWDAEEIIVVLQGNGAITTITSGSKESFNLRPGDIFKLSTGANAYVINKDNREKLVMALFLKPVANFDGEIQQYYGNGGKQPKSYLSVFSTQLLEAAFNTNSNNLQKWLGQGQCEAIMKASRNQINALSPQKGAESPNAIINLFEKTPVLHNDYGEHHEVNCSDYRPLEDLDVSVSYKKIAQGAMTTPFYKSKSTKIALVVSGEGYLEMACPHLASSCSCSSRGSQQQGQPLTYTRVSAHLKPGMVFVVPAAHPMIMAASSKNQAFEILAFDINVRNNQRVALAGISSIFNQMENESKELGFEMPAKEVNEILSSQKQDWFMKGPSQLPQ